MHRPYLNAVARKLPKAEIVFDKFHVLQHASAALDEVRRQEFFRAGAVMRAFGRGKRWLLLRRWKTVRGSKRAEVQQLLPPIIGCSKPMSCASNSIGSVEDLVALLVHHGRSWPRQSVTHEAMVRTSIVGSGRARS